MASSSSSNGDSISIANNSNHHSHSSHRFTSRSQHNHKDLILFDLHPPSDSVEAIAKFMMKYALIPNIEFEGKLGFICQRAHALSSGIVRLNLGVIGTTPLKPDAHNTFFKSGIDKKVFARLNHMLNKWFESRNIARPNAQKYKHSREVDHFHGNNIRVSVDAQTHQYIRAVQKSSLEHLEIHVPSCPYDIRLSANQETPVDIPVTPCLRIRNKDRISYQFGVFSLDITEVSTYTHIREHKAIGDPTKSFELEMEIVNNEVLKKFAHARSYPFDICLGWLTSLSLCSRYADPNHSMPKVCRHISSKSTLVGQKRALSASPIVNHQHDEFTLPGSSNDASVTDTDSADSAEKKR